MIRDRQDEYYGAINRSNCEGSSTPFIEFMLSVIKEALEDAVETAKGDNAAGGSAVHTAQIGSFNREE